MRQPRLITIPMSHYCERARWALEYARVDYTQDGHLQGFHYAAVKAAGAGISVPAMVAPDGSVLRDSAEIVQWAARRAPAHRCLYPEAPHERSEIERKEHWLSERLGVASRRWIYAVVIDDTEIAMRYARSEVPAWQRHIAPLALPFMRKLLRARVGIDEAQVQAAGEEIDSTFDAVAELRSDGRAFLCGDAFTAADITLASMAAPVLLPREYGIRLPEIAELPAWARPRLEAWRAHPTGQFCQQLYRDFRRA